MQCVKFWYALNMPTVLKESRHEVPFLQFGGRLCAISKAQLTTIVKLGFSLVKRNRLSGKIQNCQTVHFFFRVLKNFRVLFEKFSNCSPTENLRLKMSVFSVKTCFVRCS
jgi:hypothetical protein